MPDKVFPVGVTEFVRVLMWKRVQPLSSSQDKESDIIVKLAWNINPWQPILKEAREASGLA